MYFYPASTFRNECHPANLVQNTKWWETTGVDRGRSRPLCCAEARGLADNGGCRRVLDRAGTLVKLPRGRGKAIKKKQPSLFIRLTTFYFTRRDIVF